MATTSITTAGGVVIVTQVIPKDDSSIPLQTPANSASKAPPTDAKTPPPPSKEVTKASTFLRGEPHGLGVVQIFIGLLCVVFSLTAILSPTMMVHAPFALGAMFVVSGSLSVMARNGTSVRLVCVSLLFNTFSAVLGLVGVVYLCFLLADTPPADKICSSADDSSTLYQSKCSSNLWRLNIILYGLLGLFLVLFILQVCVSITISIFSGRLLRSYKRYSHLTVDDSSIPVESDLQSNSP
uniref:Wu:fb12e11 n=2 Tax=Nothobranchius TaxID=28779 RepID=A0A1A8UWK2_NOTFU|nr:membrane-spanning 4-domains subfamily A member 4A [Nothobranchius furzeri]